MEGCQSVPYADEVAVTRGDERGGRRGESRVVGFVGGRKESRFL